MDALEFTGQAPSESLCARCSRLGKTCCQGTEIYLTPADRDRIAQHLGRQDFHEFCPPINPAYADQDHDPLWRELVFRPDGSRRILKHRPGGDCSMLGPQGCRLPLEVRPLVCRLYPYDYNEHGLQPQLVSGCPMHLLPLGQSLSAALEMDLASVRRWHRQLYDEIHLEKAADAYRADLRPAC